MSNRDIPMERALIIEACKAYGFDGQEVADYVHSRMGLEDWRDFDDRDFGLEGIEEGADGCAYATGGIAQLALFPESEERAEAMSEYAAMIKCAAGMTYHGRRVRSLLRDIRNDVKLAAT